MRNSRTFCPVFLFVLHCATGTSPAVSQTSFADSSRLNDSVYVSSRVRLIADSALFASLDLSLPGLVRTGEAFRRKAFPAAYAAWGEFRASSQRPRFTSLSDRLLIDTELLVSHDHFRSVLADHPAERDSLLARAGMVLRNRIRAWGRTEVQFPGQVDFNVDVGKTGKYGFHYWGWSQPLLGAYLLTTDRKYLDKFEELFAIWYAQRNEISSPLPEFDVVYYELGLAVRTRYFIEHDLLAAGRRTPDAYERTLKTVLGAARWLYELQRCEGYRPGNWQMHGSYLLLLASLVYPEFKESGEWFSMGLRRIVEHVNEDFLADGGHSERSPRNYTLATYSILRNVWYLLDVHRKAPEHAGRILQSLGRTIDWWIAMIAPTGEIPAINDSHRGLFPTRILEDARDRHQMPEIDGILQRLFHRPFETPQPVPAYTSRHMPASGFTVIRTDWSQEALYMNINHGRWSGNHMHPDILSFEAYANGIPLAIDAGIGTTYDDPLHSSWYKSSRAHNMVVVNDADADHQTAEGKDIIWQTAGPLQYFSGRHEGYRRFGVSHRRNILFVSPSYWLLWDDLSTSRTGDTISWYLHSPSAIIPASDAWRTAGNRGMWILPLGAPGTAQVGTGMAASTVDPTPGSTQEASWIRFDRTSQATGDLRFTIVLVPFKSIVPPPACTAVDSRHLRIRMPLFTDDLYIRPGEKPTGEIETDAECVWIRSRNGLRQDVGMILGTYLKIGGAEVVRTAERSSRVIPVR